MKGPRGAALPLAAIGLVLGIASALLGADWVEDALDMLLAPSGHGRMSFSGAARVVDGDTLEIDGRRVRLAGVDAPELAQTCTGGDGQSLPCGQQVRVALSAFIGHGVVSCMEAGTDRFERTLARCRVRGQDLGEWLVANGLAAAYAGQSGKPLRAAEATARAAGAGLWAGEFERPGAWRRRRGDD
jgi:endonuclease YncB( thermonuclease family)